MKNTRRFKRSKAILAAMLTVLVDTSNPDHWETKPLGVCLHCLGFWKERYDVA